MQDFLSTNLCRFMGTLKVISTNRLLTTVDNNTEPIEGQADYIST